MGGARLMDPYLPSLAPGAVCHRLALGATIGKYGAQSVFLDICSVMARHGQIFNPFPLAQV
jgi:hypothetical protein